MRAVEGLEEEQTLQVRSHPSAGSPARGCSRPGPSPASQSSHPLRLGSLRWHTPIILTLWRWRRESQEFKIINSYAASSRSAGATGVPALNKQTSTKKKKYTERQGEGSGEVFYAKGLSKPCCSRTILSQILPLPLQTLNSFLFRSSRPGPALCLPNSLNFICIFADHHAWLLNEPFIHLCMCLCTCVR